jgi:hypothetical protein
MASVEHFLSDNPEFQDDASSEVASDDIRLEVTLIGITPKHVKFAHLGTEYSVDRDQVVGIDQAGEPPSGRNVTLTLKRDASLMAVHAVAADALVRSLPFGMLRAGAAPRRLVPSERELAWREVSGYGRRYPSLDIYLAPFQTVTVCDSYSAGILDDSLADDERADY